MSNLRPECRSGRGYPCPSEETAYYLISESVAKRRELAAGALHKRGLSCAIGTFFDDHPYYALPDSVIQEVAAVNDSYKRVSPRLRWRNVNSWLQWKVRVLAAVKSKR
jgi:hypothetical protein